MNESCHCNNDDGKKDNNLPANRAEKNPFHVCAGIYPTPIASQPQPDARKGRHYDRIWEVQIRMLVPKSIKRSVPIGLADWAVFQIVASRILRKRTSKSEYEA
jgi:hypothetical protein